MRNISKVYYNHLFNSINTVRVTDEKGEQLDLYHGIEKAGHLIIAQAELGKKMMFIGNGASASIASHMSTDFWKNGGIKAIAFNDSALLTCVSNDFGYKHVFEKPIEVFADSGDILFAISSSGQSENIICGVQTIKSIEGQAITLSGFSPDNPLSLLGDINFYVPAEEYGLVEVVHHSICHCILDTLRKHKNG